MNKNSPVSFHKTVFDHGASSAPAVETLLNLRLELLARVEQLPTVVVNKVPILTATGTTIRLPGPWAIVEESPRTPTTPHGSSVIDDDVDDADDGESVSVEDSTADRFVVRNEFGHVRIQPLVELLESGREYGRSLAGHNSLRVGGHCVLPVDEFEACIAEGFGEKHPFAGRLHPIAGSVIPETTLLFYGPNSEEELERVWSIIQKSYEWVRAGSSIA